MARPQEHPRGASSIHLEVKTLERPLLGALKGGAWETMSSEEVVTVLSRVIVWEQTQLVQPALTIRQTSLSFDVPASFAVALKRDFL